MYIQTNRPARSTQPLRLATTAAIVAEQLAASSTARPSATVKLAASDAGTCPTAWTSWLTAVSLTTGAIGAGEVWLRAWTRPRWTNASARPIPLAITAAFQATPGHYLEKSAFTPPTYSSPIRVTRAITCFRAVTANQIHLIN